MEKPKACRSPNAYGTSVLSRVLSRYRSKCTCDTTKTSAFGGKMEDIQA